LSIKIHFIALKTKNSVVKNESRRKYGREVTPVDQPVKL
jgi:ribosomal protein L39E